MVISGLTYSWAFPGYPPFCTPLTPGQSVNGLTFHFFVVDCTIRFDNDREELRIEHQIFFLRKNG